ncbi:glycosyltransferase family 2 protein [Kluyvera sichuanensis]|uniref:glycosyltransferase family 2 protein n=1 Tax=Kluyvera sichuanensis TaxID=2725494 RepID=UPI003F66CDE3
MSDIKVSICVVSYNQKEYIGSCIESLINQDCDFPYEIIIGDDGSRDGTTDVIEYYAKKYPELIRVILHKKNIGAFNNVLSVYKMARGDYIAHIDGDDLALNDKISLQANILDSNPYFSMVSHEVSLIDRDGKKIKEKYKNFPEGIYTIDDLYNELPFFAHSSKMFRNDLNSSFWSKLSTDTIDIEIHVKQARNGNIYHLNKALGCYRIFTGLSIVQNKVNPKLVIGCHRVFNDALVHSENSDKIKKFYARAILKYAYQSAVLGDSYGARLYAKRSLNIKVISFLQVCLFVLSSFPGLVVKLCKFRAALKGLNSK